MVENQKPVAGVLVLVVGASGVGKDTLLAAARSHFADDPRLLFPQRIITRTDSTGEDHIYLSEEEFAAVKSTDGFFLDWQAHGLSYGIPASIQPALADGAVVVVNVSRKVIDAARKKWSQVKVVHLTTKPEVLRERLQKRGRETPEEIEKRVERASAVSVAEDENTTNIDNSGLPQEAISEFISLLGLIGDVNGQNRL